VTRTTRAGPRLLGSPTVQARELKISDAWEFTPRVFGDDRGAFLEWYKADVFEEAVGQRFELVQANHSVSRRGVLRGIHFAAVPPGQAKYVYCPQGAVLDVVIDIRVGSPTFGEWDAVRLDEVDRRAMYLSEGLGHAFMALEDDSLVTYLCSTGYSPGREFGTDPLDPHLSLPWPDDIAAVLSDKDADAPSLAQAAEQGLLPTYAECQEYYATLRG
jgi:dTDP-4-dehydrorhamnose 3,5-epimerase